MSSKIWAPLGLLLLISNLSCKTSSTAGLSTEDVVQQKSNSSQFNIRAVAYGFVPKGAPPPGGGSTIKGIDVPLPNPFTHDGNEIKTYGDLYRLDAKLMAAKGINTIRTYAKVPAEHAKILDIFHDQNIKTIIGIGGYTETTESVKSYVAALKPWRQKGAILAYELGNEWNINFLYHPEHDKVNAFDLRQPKSLELFLQTTRTLVAMLEGVEQADPEAKISSVLAGVYSEAYLSAILPDQVMPGTGEKLTGLKKSLFDRLDLWGMNIYPGHTTGIMKRTIDDVAAIFSKFGVNTPLYISEFGIDAWDGRQNIENQPMQNESLSQLMSAVYCNDKVVGGAIMAWADEWWKARGPNDNNAAVQSNGAVSIPLGQPDGQSNEEWYGIMTIERQPRQAYTNLSFGCN